MVVRVLGVIIGAISIWAGTDMLMLEVFDSYKEKISAIIMVFMGVVFVHYGVAGKLIFTIFKRK
ncbi:hypothetical protein CWB99_10955 [Pseudoalteromonas rubra]|uniref:Uncharacterized protein n=1 Tax=Pseudoalteromonas rubra TaxID=43658 RepID=A0A5S3WLS1_9GAMM|nr:hypothetical protein CWB99_10955 [Pseudoalteromonas rubra]TMP28806.1 hypothetical protein CWC00_20800 [Pseudoalteromonas rubra]